MVSQLTRMGAKYAPVKRSYPRKAIVVPFKRVRQSPVPMVSLSTPTVVPLAIACHRRPLKLRKVGDWKLVYPQVLQKFALTLKGFYSKLFNSAHMLI